MFENRRRTALAAVLRDRGVESDLVLAVPRGGLPVGRIVADSLGVPLDVVVARKLGAPGNPELAMGAVASDGTTWLNTRLIDDLGVDRAEVDETVRRERAAAAEKLDRYRGDRPPLDLRGKRVVIVDDGIATGATTIACARQVREAGAEHVVLAIPVAPPGTVEGLADGVDEMVAVETPRRYGAVGQFYRSFGQVSDAAARSYLDSEA
jgi:putative phosphoribosyl transferase